MRIVKFTLVNPIFFIYDFSSNKRWHKGTFLFLVDQISESLIYMLYNTFLSCKGVLPLHIIKNRE